MKKAARAAAVLFLCPLGAVFLFPPAATAAGSLMAENAIGTAYSSRLNAFDLAEGIREKFRCIPLVPGPASLEQYAEVLLRQPSFLTLLFNSLAIALPVSLGALAVALLSAYGFGRWRWKHKEAVFSVYVAVMLMPLQAVLVPNYIIAALLGIRDSTLAIILPGIFSPFGVFLMRQSLKAVPPAYFEAAEMDGAGGWYVLFHVAIPQLKPAVSALFMLVFIEYWNVVEQAVVFIDDFTKEPLSVYLSRLAEGRAGLVLAASCVYMFPPLWLLFAGQRDLERGIELSGLR
ncbi:MAG: carbohydrate ABC transporter permease [Treponema sp.]|jgi:multiple sugar transport system permease protein|nr:carbohydrate ABC transporter permease [Treponema sp.]